MSNLEFLHSVVAREITNGQWFLAMSFLAGHLIWFLAPRLRAEPSLWRHTVGVRLAWGMMLIALGTALRAGWIWAILIAENVASRSTTEFLDSLGWITYVAIGLGVWGALCVVKAVTEAARGLDGLLGYTTGLLIYWISVVVVTLALPVLTYALL